jgi:hypothetical protein
MEGEIGTMVLLLQLWSGSAGPESAGEEELILESVTLKEYRK